MFMFYIMYYATYQHVRIFIFDKNIMKCYNALVEHVQDHIYTFIINKQSKIIINDLYLVTSYITRKP